jgi:hypothetical protein
VLTLVARRALDQRRPLVAVLLLVTAATTLFGICALLVGPTQDKAFRAGVRELQPPDVDVTAYVVDLRGSDLAGARDDAASVVREVLAGLRPTLTSTADSRMRRLEDGKGLAYLATGEGLEEGTELVSGRWPRDGAGDVTEAAVPDAAASRLGLALGDTVTLGAETGLEGAHEPVTVSVVGTFRTIGGRPGDPLSGVGYDPAYGDGASFIPAYGPFLVGDAAFLASGSGVAGLQVTGHPTLAVADDPSLQTASRALDEGSASLSARIGDRARITRLGSALPATLDRLHAEQATTRSTVVVVLLIAAALAMAALLLTGRVLVAVRDDERALLVGLGLSPSQQLRAASTEALLVGLVAAAVSLPAAAVAHSCLTHLPAMAAAGLRQGPSMTPGLVLTVVAGAALLAAALVGPALDRARTAHTWSRRRAVASTALDLLLLAVAGVAWWQLHAQPATAEPDVDLVVILAPAAALAATTTVVVRRVPFLLTTLARGGARARSLVLPMAVQQAARRPRTVLAPVLVATAVAAATFAVGLQATWERSQHDQADLRVGTDLALTLAAPATAGDANAVAAAASGRAVSPVAVTALPLGHYVGEPGAAPRLVAIDAHRAGELLRGRHDHRSWASLGAMITPGSPVTGIPVGGLDQVSLGGRAASSAAVTVAATFVVQDATGLRNPVAADPVALDGTRHPLRWRSPLPDGQVVAIRLVVDAPGLPATDTTAATPVTVSLVLPGGPPGGTWQARAMGEQSPLQGATLEVAPGAGGTIVRTRTDVDLSYLAYTDGVLLATAFDPPQDVPVVVSRRLAAATGAGVGEEVAGTMGDAVLPLRIVAVVPEVPSAPGRAAVLADVDTLSRALIGEGHLDPAADAWWVSDPAPGTAGALRSLRLGDVVTRSQVAEQLSRGPLRVTTPTALGLLVGASVALLLAGGGLVVGADQRRRASEAARLRALGLTRRQTRRLLLAEHFLLLAPLIVLGWLVGAAASWALGPPLVRSDLGGAPVPDAAVVWPWAVEGLLLGGVLVACTLVCVAIAILQVRRSHPRLLRTDEW